MFNASILFETPPSDLFRHLQVGQTECRKRRIWVGRVKLYISALRLEDGELLLVVSPMLNASAIRDYALRWEIETLFSCLKGRGFNLENTRLTDPRRVKKLIAVLAIGFCWCYLTGEWQHDRKKAIKIKEAWTTFSKFISLRFGPCSNGYSTFDWFWEKRRI